MNIEEEDEEVYVEYYPASVEESEDILGKYLEMNDMEITEYLNKENCIEIAIYNKIKKHIQKSTVDDIIKKSSNIADRLKQFSSNEIPKKEEQKNQKEEKEKSIVDDIIKKSSNIAFIFITFLFQDLFSHNAKHLSFFCLFFFLFLYRFVLLFFN